MQVTVLASGSGGNASLFESNGTRILVDGGLSGRALAALIPTLDAIVVTHAHSDHVAHSDTIARRFGAKLFVSEATARSFSPKVTPQIYSPREPFAIGALTVRPTPLPHDAAQVALVVDDGTRSAAIVTDLGEVPPALLAHIERCDVLLLESNHDVGLLETGPYPAHLKKRIRSAKGHLSNEQTNELLRHLYAAPARRGARALAPHTVVLMHLSKTNNLPDLCLAAATDTLAGRAVDLRVAPPRGAVVIDASGRPRCALTSGPQQLTLW